MRERQEEIDQDLERYEKAMLSLRAREAKLEKAKNGDSDALMECMYDFGMISKEAFEDYYKIKERYGDEKEVY